MENEKEQSKSFVIVEFDGIGSAQFKMNAQGVTPMQLLLLGDYIQLTAKNQILAQEQQVRNQQERMTKIEVPEGKIVTSRR